MRTSIIATASVLALLASPVALQPAWSQDTTAPAPTQPRPPGSLSAPLPPPRAPAPNPLTLEDVSLIKGSVVYGSDEKKIGSISTVLMQPDTKTVDRLVVQEGGLLGIGSHRVALPIDAFTWDGRKEGFTIAKTVDELKQMPPWTVAGENSAPMPSTGSSMPPASKPGATLPGSTAPGSTGKSPTGQSPIGQSSGGTSAPSE